MTSRFSKTSSSTKIPRKSVTGCRFTRFHANIHASDSSTNPVSEAFPTLVASEQGMLLHFDSRYRFEMFSLFFVDILIRLLNLNIIYYRDSAPNEVVSLEISLTRTAKLVWRENMIWWLDAFVGWGKTFQSLSTSFLWRCNPETSGYKLTKTDQCSKRSGRGGAGLRPYNVIEQWNRPNNVSCEIQILVEYIIFRKDAKTCRTASRNWLRRLPGNPWFFSAEIRIWS